MKNNTILRHLQLKTSIIASLFLAAIFSNSAIAVTLYKWVDAEGNVSYQDHPPPLGQKYEEKSFSDEGARTGDTNTDIARSRAIRENPVMLFVAENCDSCDLVARVLESNKIPYETTAVDTDPDAQRKLIDLAGSMRVPTLTIGSKIIDSSNRAAIEDALRNNGYPSPEIQAGPQ